MRVGLDAIDGSGAMVTGSTPGGACRVVCVLIHDVICFLALSTFSSAVTIATFASQQIMTSLGATICRRFSPRQHYMPLPVISRWTTNGQARPRRA